VFFVGSHKNLGVVYDPLGILNLAIRAERNVRGRNSLRIRGVIEVCFIFCPAKMIRRRSDDNTVGGKGENQLAVAD